MQAIQNGQGTVVKSLLKYNADPAMATKYAILDGQHVILKLLLDHGVRLDMWGYHDTDCMNCSALMYAAAKGKIISFIKII